MLRRTRRLSIPLTLSAALIAATLAAPAFAEPVSPTAWKPATKTEKSVAGKDFVAHARPADPQATSILHKPQAVSWPSPGSAQVTLPAIDMVSAGSPVRAGTLPVSVAAAKIGQTPSAVRVELLDRKAAMSVGASGLLLTVRRTDTTPADAIADSARVNVAVDYSAFRWAYGGDWATRLKLVELPACALTTPQAASCSTGERLDGFNNVTAGRIDADVAVSSGMTVLALTAGSGGNSGDFKASSLAPSASWEAGNAAGNFTWNYPMEVPDGLGGPEPDLDLGYSSGGIDGRVASTNNQSTWAGEGWDLTESFVERRYKSCYDEVTTTPKPQDLCWYTDNAFVMLEGKALELVKDSATGVWRAREDDGTRIERFTGTVNGDSDGEYWKITAVNGTQYFFGLNRLPGWTSGGEETASTWTVPVFGNDAGEPCHASTFAASYCDQAWRWNLDYVVDAHGNAESLFYTTETNYYGRNLTASAGTKYVRAGNLKRIDYGQRSDSIYSAAAPMRVTFATEERCADGATCAATDTITSANASKWPDVPYDQNCASEATCTNLYSPTFWTRRRLNAITTQLWDSTTSAYRDTETWSMGYQFRDPGDGTSPILWLASLTDTGKVGGTQALAPVTFQGVQMENRVDAMEGVPPMNKWRITDVYDESGGHVHVNYTLKDCTSTTLPGIDNNTRRCFPEYWQADAGSSLTLDWFHKYVPTQVLESDISGVAGTEETDYEYLDGGAWHYDDNDLTPTKYRTWGQWRGFARVRMTHGDSSGVRTSQETLFMRGMNGDKLVSGTRTATVTDSNGTILNDDPSLAGFHRETVVYSRAGGADERAVIADPWTSTPTATSGSTKAYMMDAAIEHERIALPGGGYRLTERRTTYDAYGQVAQVDDLGDTATSADDQCTRTTYARNTTAWIVDTEARVESVSVACSVTPSYPNDTISDKRISYDGQAYGVAPTQGDETKVEEVASYSGTTPVYAQSSRAVYDAYGRIVEAYDELDAKTATVFTPATGGPVTATTVTNPAGFVTTTTQEPAWGAELMITDPNGRKTEMARDPLGRLTAVWLPNRSRSSGQTPNEKFTYLIRTDSPSVVTDEEIRDDGTYDPTYTFYDGRLRQRQTQEVAPDGGRIVTDTFYDSHGLEAKSNRPYWNSGAAGTTLLTGVADSAVPGQDLTLYDGAERKQSQIYRSYGVEKWRTTTGYIGDDQIDETPPTGGTATSKIFDSDDRLIELRQYTGGIPTGSYDSTKYTYTKSGQLATVTDSAGNVWTHTYDLRGREVQTVDPDRGTTTSTYDDADQLTSSTDARGVTLAYTYDSLGRKTAVYEGSTTGVKRAEWKYDTLSTGAVVKGQLASSIRYNNGNAYTESIDSYDVLYRPLVTTATIPAAEGALAGSYRVATGYTATGLPSTISYPAAGGLSAETLRYGYDAYGRLQTAQTGMNTLLTGATYTPYGETSQLTLSAVTGQQLSRTFFYEDGTRRLIRAMVDRSTAPQHLSDIAYTYDPAGNILKIADTPSGGASDVQCFGYDYLQRLTSAWTATDNCANKTPTASIIGGVDPYWQSWTYDKTGNRLSETNFTPSTDTSTTSTYAYPAAGAARPHALGSVTAGSRVDSYGYDATGNTTSRTVAGTGQTLTWDPEGDIASVTQDGKTSTYLYNADGDRLIRHDPDATTLYIGDTELRLPSGGTASATRYFDLGSVIAVRGPLGLSFETSDLRGTATLAVNATDLTVTQRRYLPFGTPRGAAPASWPDGKGYVGGVNDTSIGLTRLGAREYDAVAGRFISVDPLIDVNDPQQMNGYAYANNTPIVADDADGEMYMAGDGPRHGPGYYKKHSVKRVKHIVKRIGKKWRSVGKLFHRIVQKVKHSIKKVIRHVRRIAHRVARAVVNWAKKHLSWKKIKHYGSVAKNKLSEWWRKYRAAVKSSREARKKRERENAYHTCSPYDHTGFSCLNGWVQKGSDKVADGWDKVCHVVGVGGNGGGVLTGLLSFAKKPWAKAAGWAGVTISGVGGLCQITQ
jgi:RHS repeat-associated protein